LDIKRVTLLGNKDHGKSTLIGSLLIATGSATKQRIEEAKNVSRKLGRNFEPGFILDSFEEEREGGLTIDTTRAQITYKDAAFEFIDVPGHEELIGNMISGASYGDFAVLMVSAKDGEGITEQTRRHLMLAKLLGISRVVVAVNKMDTVAYKKEKFELIVDAVKEFCMNIGFEPGSVVFVPVSAYNADNLVKRSARIRWYVGKPLMELVYEAASAKKRGSNGLRLLFQGTIKSGRKTLYTGKVVNGRLRRGQKIRIMPIGRNAVVNSIYVKGKEMRAASEGKNVALEILGAYATRGCVGFDLESNPRCGTEFEAMVFSVEKIPKKVQLRMNGSELMADVAVFGEIDLKSGRLKEARSIKPLGTGKAKVRLLENTIIESATECPEMGRFLLYDSGKFAGIGIIN
jgi:translation elongation factor EF-1alpha